MEKAEIKKYLQLFPDAWKVFMDNHPVKFASAFAYFSLFGLPSILIIIIIILSAGFEPSMLFDQLREQLASVLGGESADIMVTITSNYMEQAGENTWNMLFYTVTIFLLATQLLKFFQDILNDLWQIKPDFNNIWQKLWKERGLPFLMVLVTGLLFFSSAAVELALDVTTGDVLNSTIREVVVNIITALMVFFWFATLYKVLPFVNLKWEPTLVGAAVTSVLFFIGALLLWGLVVTEESLEKVYDYVAPVVLFCFWIFYTSMAFLYGASLTRVYAQMKNKKITPKSYAFNYEIVETKKNIE